MNPDACLGFSVMAYQVRDMAHGHCEAWKSTLVRLEGPHSKSHDAGRGNPVRRGKVGYCLRRVRATNVAIPKTYPLGPYGSIKRTGIRISAEFGP